MKKNVFKHKALKRICSCILSGLLILSLTGTAVFAEPETEAAVVGTGETTDDLNTAGSDEMDNAIDQDITSGNDEEETDSGVIEEVSEEDIYQHQRI